MAAAYRSPRRPMIQRVLLWVSTICTVIVVVSFGLFALEEAGASSKKQEAAVDQVNEPDPTPHTERAREQKHTAVREAIDDANDILVSPFTGIVSSDNIWVQRGIPSLLAFFLYFVVLRIVAGYAVRIRGPALTGR
jgi:hypothetical protein